MKTLLLIGIGAGNPEHITVQAINALNRALNSPSDEAHDVARQIVRALVRNAVELQIGFPERIFTWLNGFAPSVIDRALAGKLATVKEHALPRP